MAFGTSLDAQGLSISELDLDVLLIDSGKLAMELITILDLLHIEARLEGLKLRQIAEVSKLIALTRDLVRSVVVKKAEERGEFARREAWEGEHCSDWSRLSDFDDSVSLRELVGDAVVLHVIVCLVVVVVSYSDDEIPWWTRLQPLYLLANAPGSHL